MNIDTTRGENVTVITPRGKLVIGEPVDTFEKKVSELVGAGVKYVVIDLSDVNRLDSSGVGSLVFALRKCRDSGGDARLANPSDHLKKILQTMGLLQVFQVHDSVEDAQASLS